jgi:hydrogenase nickel incorporation protein HypA/HybF
MHEMSIVQALIEQVEGEIERAGQTGRVTRLELAIGTLSGVHADSIRFAFELMSPGTVVEHAELVITHPAAHLTCRQCGAAPEIPELIMTCPACGSTDITIAGGTDLLLQTIELDDS